MGRGRPRRGSRGLGASEEVGVDAVIGARDAFDEPIGLEGADGAPCLACGEAGGKGEVGDGRAYEGDVAGEVTFGEEDEVELGGDWGEFLQGGGVVGGEEGGQLGVCSGGGG